MLSVGFYLVYLNFIPNRLTPVVPKVCFADPKGSVTSCKGICRYIHVMATLKFTYCFN